MHYIEERVRVELVYCNKIGQIGKVAVVLVLQPHQQCYFWGNKLEELSLL